MCEYEFKSRPGSITAFPKRILVATDLSARCDRALSRAAHLAGDWNAELVFVHSIDSESGSTSNFRDRPLSSRSGASVSALRAEESIRRTVDRIAPGSDIIIRIGDAVDVISAVAKSENCDFIIAGMPRDETLTRLGLRRSIDRLAKQTGLPVLSVRQDGTAAYKKIAIAVAFSKASRHALETAAGFFPGKQLTVLHAYESPWVGLGSGANDEYRKMATSECAAFVATTSIWRATTSHLKLVVDEGNPPAVIGGYAHDQRPDLIVIGATNRGALLSMLFGSMTTELLTTLPCDILVVGLLPTHNHVRPLSLDRLKRLDDFRSDLRAISLQRARRKSSGAEQRNDCGRVHSYVELT